MDTTINNASSVVVNILVNSRTAAKGIQEFNQIMSRVAKIAEQSAKESRNSFNQIFGANFFANLASSFTQSLSQAFRTTLRDALRFSSEFESAFKGLGSIASSVGLSAQDTVQTVKNLQLVKSGLLTVGDAATSVKNLLASGFNLNESIELIKRFGDTAAFGRQSSLSFGRAISSATEGIKNQNSILVDNAGVTKNLSVILKEQGFTIQDLSDKVNGAAARQALYVGLIKETTLQQGDANKLLDTTQGKLTQINTAYERFAAKLGDVVTQNQAVKTVLGAVAGTLDAVGNNIGKVTLLTSSIALMTTVVVLSSTSFNTLTGSQIANALASSRVVAGISTVIKAMAALRAGTALTAGTMVIATGGFLAIAGVIAAVVAAIYSYTSATAEAESITASQIESLAKQRDSYQDTLKEIRDVSTKQDRLTSIYTSLNVESQTRIQLIESESGRTNALAKEIENLSNAQNSQLENVGRVATREFITKLEEINQLESQANTLNQQINNLRDRARQLSERNPNELVLSSNIQYAGAQVSAAQETEFLRNKSQQLENTLVSLNTTLQGTHGETTELAKRQESLADAQGKTIDETISQTLAVDGLTAKTNAIITAKNAFIATEQNQKAAIDLTNLSLIEQYNRITQLDERQAFRSKEISRRIKDVSEFSIVGTPNTKVATDLAIETLKADPTFLEFQRQEKVFQAVQDSLNKEFSTAPEKRKRKTKSEFESLTDSVKKLNAEVASFQNLSSKEFRLRFQREELERVRRDFEAIVDLRRDLGLPLNVPLPSNAENLKAEIDGLKRIKSIRDDILAINRESVDAEDKLLVARLSANAAVISAQTRANKAYYDGIRERRNAEQQLTADLATEFRRRERFSKDFISNVESAQAEALKDVLREQTDADTQRLKDVARLQILAGEVFKENPLVKAAAAISNQKPDVSPVVTKLERSNVLLGQILVAVKTQNAGSFGASGGNGSFSGSIGLSSIPQSLRASGVSKRGREVLALVLKPSRFDGDLMDVAGLIANQNGVDPRLMFLMLKATLFRESNGVAGLTSSKGAKGYFQQLPDTSRKLGVSDPNNFRQAATGAGRYLLGGFSGQAGLRGGGLPEAFATYFAGEAGGNRGRNTRQYVTDQVYVISQALNQNALHPNVPKGGKILRISRTEAANIDPTKFTAYDPNTGEIVNAPQTAIGNIQTATANRPQTINNAANTLSQDFLGLPIDSPHLQDSSLDALKNFLQTKKEIDRLGSTDAERLENLKKQSVGQERLNQVIRVTFDQVKQLAVVEDSINRIRKGESIAITETLNAANLERQRTLESNLKSLIETRDLISKYDSGDQKLIGEVITEADAQTASATAAAYKEIAQTKNFLERFRAGDKEILEFVEKTRQQRRDGEIKNLTLDVADSEALAGSGGRDREKEQLEFRRRLADSTINLGQAERELEDFRKLRGNQTLIREQRQTSVLREQTDILRQLADLEDERATGGINQALRVRLAIEQELANIRRDDLRATEDAAKARVRIDDLTVYHQERSNARVLEHIASMKSLTDIYSDAKTAIIDKVWGGLDSLFDSLTRKIPIFGNVLSDILANITKLALNPLILKLLGLSNNTNNSSGGFLSGIGNVLTSGGTPPFNPNAGGGGASSLFAQYFNQGNPAAAAGGNRGNTSGLFPFLTGFNQQSAAGGGGSSQTQFLDLINRAGLGDSLDFGTAASSASTLAHEGTHASQVSAGGGGIAGALRNAAPLLGLSLGTSVGGQSGTGQILGGIGGGLLGLVGGAFGSSSTAFGGAFGSIGGFLGISGAATLGIGAAIGGVALLASYFLGRSKRRREEEKIRTRVLLDSKSQLNEVLRQLRAGNIDSASALSQAEAIRQNYMEQVGQLKDKKTRRIAQQTVRELDSLITVIKHQGRITDYALAQEDAFVPTFDVGGFLGGGGLPSRRTRETTVAAFTPETEAVISRQQIYSLGGYPALKKAGVSGTSMQPSDAVRQSTAFNRLDPTRGGSDGSGNITIFVVANKRAAVEMAKQAGGKVLIEEMQPLIESGQDAGFVKSIGDRFAEGTD